MTDPDPIDLGTLTRQADAGTELLRRLANHQRVREKFFAWCYARGLSAIVVQLQHADATTRAEFARLASDNNLGTPDDLVWLGVFARDELHLPFPWLPELLFEMFRLWIVNLGGGTPLEIPRLTPNIAARERLKPGKAPLATLRQDVEWYYRTVVMQESVAALAAERFKATGIHLENPTGSIRVACKRVEQWLTSLDRHLLRLDS
jgi:hypothetical protein